MRIGISFSGEGWGHVAKIAPIAKKLKTQHTLIFWCPHTVHTKLHELLPGHTVHTVPYLEQIYTRGKIDIPRTFATNAKTFATGKKLITRLAQELRSEKIDAVISDYEPFLPRAAQKNKLPVITFNSHAATNRIKSARPDALLLRAVNAIIIPHGTQTLVTSFYEGDIGPIVRSEILDKTTSTQDHLVVYAKPNIRHIVLPYLRAHHIPFHLFPSQEHDFATSLASCRGVISTAGHQLTSECLILKKPMLLIPESGSYEQILNAKMSASAGWAIHTNIRRLKRDLATFISTLDKFPYPRTDHKTKFILHDDTERAVHKLNAMLTRSHSSPTYPR